MESFPPENTEQAGKRREQKPAHKSAAIVADFTDDKKRQAAEIVYLERYE